MSTVLVMVMIYREVRFGGTSRGGGGGKLPKRERLGGRSYLERSITQQT